MVKKGPSNLGLVFLLLLVVLVSCSNGCALASPQELHPSSGLRREMRLVKSSYSRRAGGHGGRGGVHHGGRGPPPPLTSPPSPPLSMSPPLSVPLSNP
ncbi:hypothetical protein AALP_AA1G308000 [Arabis alpina]|uniref:Uncharacterized protein n=1 Tax=Arabis alpina TaxID=50452 RepID=A0A087HRS6_ARAAL|nr:hypothetical protein AALP_AA1G308000 [Arabis alpina]